MEAQQIQACKAGSLVTRCCLPLGGEAPNQRSVPHPPDGAALVAPGSWRLGPAGPSGQTNSVSCPCRPQTHVLGKFILSARSYRPSFLVNTTLWRGRSSGGPEATVRHRKLPKQPTTSSLFRGICRHEVRHKSNAPFGGGGLEGVDSSESPPLLASPLSLLGTVPY